MKLNILYDTEYYNDFTELFSMNEVDDSTLIITALHNDSTAIDFSSKTMETKLYFENVLDPDDNFSITGSDSDLDNGKFSFDFTDALLGKAGEYSEKYLVTLYIDDQTDDKQYNINAGLLTIYRNPKGQ
jgi:hypothetical protein